MQGRRFLDLAREILLGNTELHWRGAAGRAYYALLLECRDTVNRWGLTNPPSHKVHAAIRLGFTYAAVADLKQIGWALDLLIRLRNQADYDISAPGKFANSANAVDAVKLARDKIALLDVIDADPARRLAATAALRKSIP